jgi:DNA-binding transcriptional LysR family regulator
MVNYTLKQLYSFEAVVRLRSFPKAAAELNITQPAVYMQVKQLQDNIGGEIIRIEGKKITTTFLGDKLIVSSKKIIRELEKNKQEITQVLNPESGHLNIAVATTANSFVSGILADFKHKNPKITFNLEILNRSELLGKIKSKQDYIIIMGEPPAEVEDRSVVFKQNPLIAICHPEHRLLKKKKLQIHDLESEVLITREQGSGTRSTIERITGLDFNSNIEINSNEAITHSVRAGLGIGFVSEWTVNLELRAGVVSKLNLPNFPIIRNWHIVYCGDSDSKVAKKFQKFVLENS